MLVGTDKVLRIFIAINDTPNDIISHNSDTEMPILALNNTDDSPWIILYSIHVKSMRVKTTKPVEIILTVIYYIVNTLYKPVKVIKKYNLKHVYINNVIQQHMHTNKPFITRAIDKQRKKVCP